MSEDKQFTDKDFKTALEGFAGEANDYINNPDKLEKLIQQLEEKLNGIPAVGPYLSDIALMASLVRSFATNEYREINMGTIITAVACILYVVSPFDLIPDFIPGVGVIDDLALVAFVLNLIHDELAAYKKWRIDNGKEQISAHPAE